MPYNDMTNAWVHNVLVRSDWLDSMTENERSIVCQGIPTTAIMGAVQDGRTLSFGTFLYPRNTPYNYVFVTTYVTAAAAMGLWVQYQRFSLSCSIRQADLLEDWTDWWEIEGAPVTDGTYAGCQLIPIAWAGSMVVLRINLHVTGTINGASGWLYRDVEPGLYGINPV